MKADTTKSSIVQDHDETNTPKRLVIWHNALGSAAAGVISRLFTHPLDTAKARLQMVGSTYQGPYDVLRQALWQQQQHQQQFHPQHSKTTINIRGMASLYRGFGTVLLGGTPGTMVYLCSYEMIKESMGGDDSSFWVHLGGGMLAEAIACIIYVPVDVLKERMQVSNNYRNSWHGLMELWKYEGFAGVYRGYGATLASFGPFSALYFLFYEQCKILARNQTLSTFLSDGTRTTSISTTHEKELSFPSIVLCSCTAGALASWITSPLDMAKLRLQVQRAPRTLQQSSTITATNNNNNAATTMIQILTQVAKTQGIRGLFRGAGARVLHFAPATTITMTSYETCRSWLAQGI